MAHDAVLLFVDVERRRAEFGDVRGRICIVPGENAVPVVDRVFRPVTRHHVEVLVLEQLLRGKRAAHAAQRRVAGQAVPDTRGAQAAIRRVRALPVGAAAVDGAGNLV